MRSWGLPSSNFIIRMHRWKEGSVVLLIILLLCYLLTILDMTQVRNSVKLTPHKVRQICFFFLPHLNGTDGGPRNDGMPADCIPKKV